MKIEVELTDESVSNIVLEDLKFMLEVMLEEQDEEMVSALKKVIRLYTIPSELED